MYEGRPLPGAGTFVPPSGLSHENTRLIKDNMDFDSLDDAIEGAFNTDEVAPEPAADEETPEGDEPEVTEPEEAGDDEPDEEAEEVEADEDAEATEDEPEEGETPEEESEPEDQPESFLPPFDRKKVENHKDPQVRAAYKHMQAEFTRKLQAVGEKGRKAETLVGQAQRVLGEHERFTQTLASDEGAERFLIQVALRRPEVMERAYTRAAKLIDNPDEKRSFDTELERDRYRDQVRSTEARQAQEAAQKRERLISRATQREAEEAGLDGDEVNVAQRLVKARIQENKLLDGKAKITREEIKAAVAEAKRVFEARAARERAKVTAERTKEQRKRIQATNAKPRRPAPPGGRVPAAGTRPRKVPDGIDPFDFAVDDLVANL